MKKQIFLIAIAAATAAAHAGDTYVWTGAGGDGRWMNAANWSQNGSPASQPPGISYEEVTTSSANLDTISEAGLARLGEKAEFGEIENGNTTIDLDGLYSIGYITVKSGAPVYTFGTSSSQVLPLETKASVKQLTLESGLTNMPVIAATFCLGAATTGRDTNLTIQNNTGKELVIGDLGCIRRSYSTSWCYSELYLKGTGTYKITGGRVKGSSPCAGGIRPYLTAPRLTVTSTLLELASIYFEATNVVLEVAKGAEARVAGYNLEDVSANAPASIVGEGLFSMTYSVKEANMSSYGRFNIASGCTLTIDTEVRVFPTTDNKTPFLLYGGSTRSGTLYLRGTNSSEDVVMFMSANRTLKVNSPAGFGTNDTMVFRSNGRVSPAYTNGEDFVKTLAISNGFMATIANERETTMTARPKIVPLFDSTSATLCADAVTAPIILDPTFTAGQSVTLGVAGVKETRPTAAMLGAIAGVRLMGGILDVSVVPNWSPAVPVTFDTGDATIFVPDGETYTFSSLSRTAGKTTGTLNIVCGTGSAKIAGAAAGTQLPGVQLNGYSAKVGDDGAIVAAVDRQIAARGDVVPHVPSGIVGIGINGSGGNDTIEYDLTEVKELAHMARTNATVEIGENRTFMAEQLTLCGLAGDLSVGKEGDLGTVGSPSDMLRLKNDNEQSALTVNAKLADGLSVVVDNSAAPATIAGGSVNTNRILMCNAVVLNVTGERKFAFDFVVVNTNSVPGAKSTADWPTLKFDGAKDVILGERGMHAPYTYISKAGYGSLEKRGRIVVTNSLIRSDDVNRSSYPDTAYNDNEKYAIIIGNRASGIMEIQAGAVISNRLVVGAPNNGHRGLGAVYQNGGEMASLGYYGAEKVMQGSGVGISNFGCGYYNLSGGSLVALGPFAVGGYVRGYMRQIGGRFTVTNHPADTAASPLCSFYVGGSNNGDGLFWMSGGRADMFGVTRLSGGYYETDPSSAQVTIDGDAVYDAHDKAIRVISAGASPLAKPHHSYVNINGNATLRAAGFYDYSKTSANADPTNRLAAVSFNGGTFKAGANSKGIFHAHSSGGVSNLSFSVEHVYARSGGMTVDTDGKTGNYIDVPIEGPTGGGVSKVNFTPTATQASYHLPPLVTIEGDGFGATAAVDWDEKTKSFKGVTVTSPGVNYTSATAIVRLGPNSIETYTVTVPCDISPNTNAGSFTKKGEGDLTLYAANTYGGDTILAGGVLRLGATGALPNGSALVPQGGILEVANGVELPAAITVKLQDPDPTVKYDLMCFEGDFPETLPTFTVLGGDNVAWVVTRRTNKLVVGAKKGFQIIFR